MYIKKDQPLRQPRQFNVFIFIFSVTTSSPRAKSDLKKSAFEMTV